MLALRELTEDDAKVVKKFVLTTRLVKPVRLLFPHADIAIDVASMSPVQHGEFEGMKTRRLVGLDDERPVRVGGNRANLLLHVGRWNDTARLDAAHIVFGSSILSRYFGQIELSTCLADSEGVLLLKNLTKHGGAGSIKRLDGTGTPLEERIRRRERLKEVLETEVVEWNGQEQLVISRLPFKAMRENPEALLPRVLRDLLTYAGEVEQLRHAKGDGVPLEAYKTRPGWSVAPPPPEVRKRIESAAVDEATGWLVGKGFDVTSVETEDLGFDLLATKNGEELHVEVKGLARGFAPEKWSLVMTANEVKKARELKEKYMLFVAYFDNGDDLHLLDKQPLRDPFGAGRCTAEPTQYRVGPK